ncbi:MAG: SIMPL domain-containing protein, partial [Bacillota bacterium]
TVGLLAVLLVATLLGGQVIPSAARPEHSMSVSGQAILDAVPDQAQIELGLVLRATTAQDAQKQGATKMDAVIKALKDAGIKPEDIQTRYLSLNPVYEYTKDGQKFLGYELSNTVSFKTGDFAAMGGVIDKAVAAGANRVNSLQFVLKDKSKYSGQAIDQAIADARAKADAAAKSLGTKVTGVKTVSIQDNNYVPGPIYRMADSAKSMNGAAASMPVEPGQVQFQVTVNVEFVMK